MNGMLVRSSQFLVRRSMQLMAITLSIILHVFFLREFGQLTAYAMTPAVVHPVIMAQIYRLLPSSLTNETYVDNDTLNQTNNDSVGVVADPGAGLEPARLVEFSTSRPDVEFPTTSSAPSPIDPPLIPIVPPRYYSSKELSKLPRSLNDIPENFTLTLPEAAPDHVVIRILINEQGNVDAVIVEGDQLSEANMQLLKDAFGQLTFNPGRVGAVVVKSQLRLQILLNKDSVAKPIPPLYENQ